MRRGPVLVAVVLLVAATVLVVLRVAPEPGGAPELGATPTLPPGAPLPTDAQCAARVTRASWEPRPENHEANHTVPPGPVASREWETPAAEALHRRVTGDFTGTTDEIIQWTSCKWGFDTDLTRAQALQESDWRQSTRGDGGVSYGLLQIKSTYWTGTYPYSARSTAYNLDWSLGLRRACFEGDLYDGRGRGDEWGCIGAHYSGFWRDAEALQYVGLVQGYLERREWLAWPG
ncbi:hypothetical protein WIS52_01450 [Pseudonocardia nematodicida]|uniref:Transglycosylase SLT domain-containing protein n=1 Tax=Pseudonocardia nematodicida TaxID=1206997 RepID=A0ABV1K3T9_9PSEU